MLFRKMWHLLPVRIRSIMLPLKTYLLTEWFIRYYFKRHDGFNRISIETINRCNGVCPFCPVNAQQVQRPYSKMSKVLFEKLISELVEIKYAGMLRLFCNNEPFLDERIIDFSRHAKERLPGAVIEIITNGTVLSLENFKSILPYVDIMIINNYNDKKELNASIGILYEYCCNNPETLKKVEFAMRLQNEVLSNRGGQAPNNKTPRRVKTKCILPFREIVVRPDGKISLCCNDALGRYSLGDANEHSLHEIWHSESFEIIRNEMKTNGRKYLLLCQNCDWIINDLRNEAGSL